MIGHVGVEIEIGDVDDEATSTKLGVVDGAVDVQFCVWNQCSR